MTTLPNISRDDPNNSGTYNKLVLTPKFSLNGMFTGISTNTDGFNSLIINIKTDMVSTACGLLIQFSDTGTDFDGNGIINYSTVFYSDTVFPEPVNKNSFLINSGSGSFIKNYPILKKYYRINYTPSEQPNYLVISSRLCTEIYNGNFNSTKTFTNNQENIYDALGKLRVSYPKTLIDINIPAGTTGSTGFNINYLDICQDYSGTTGQTGISYNNSGLVLGVTGQAKIISQSRKYSIFQTGKSLLFIGSGIIGYNANTINSPYGYKTKIGYFDDINGFYFSYNTNSVYINTTKNKVNNPIIQKYWNIDKMDGMGPSGLFLDFTKIQIFVIDIEYNSIGRIRFGFYAFGKIFYCHQEIEIDRKLPYPSLNLPIRYEIEGLTGCTGFANLTQLSATVISEGDYNPKSKLFSFTWSYSGSMTSETPIFAIRGGGNNYYHQNIIPTQLSLGSTGFTDIFIYRMRLYLDPNDAPISPSAIWYNPDNFINYGSLSVTQGTTGTTSTTNWNNSIILNTAVISNSKIIKYNEENNNMEITADTNNSSSIIVITIEGSPTFIFGTLTWKEIY